MKSIIRLALLSATILCLAVPALAGSNEATCAATKADNISTDRIIAACTAYIGETQYPESRAAGYYNRGNAYFDKGDYQSAIADYTKAIELRPGYKAATYNRGLAKLHLGDRTGGNADIDASKSMQ